MISFIPASHKAYTIHRDDENLVYIRPVTSWMIEHRGRGMAGEKMEDEVCCEPISPNIFWDVPNYIGIYHADLKMLEDRDGGDYLCKSLFKAITVLNSLHKDIRIPNDLLNQLRDLDL